MVKYKLASDDKLHSLIRDEIYNGVQVKGHGFYTVARQVLIEVDQYLAAAEKVEAGATEGLLVAGIAVLKDIVGWSDTIHYPKSLIDITNEARNVLKSLQV